MMSLPLKTIAAKHYILYLLSKDQDDFCYYSIFWSKTSSTSHRRNQSFLERKATFAMASPRPSNFHDKNRIGWIPIPSDFAAQCIYRECTIQPRWSWMSSPSQSGRDRSHSRKCGPKNEALINLIICLFPIHIHSFTENSPLLLQFYTKDSLPSLSFISCRLDRKEVEGQHHSKQPPQSLAKAGRVLIVSPNNKENANHMIIIS